MAADAPATVYDPNPGANGTGATTDVTLRDLVHAIPYYAIKAGLIH
jgi:hypothetical protein